jgi:putative transposase
LLSRLWGRVRRRWWIREVDGDCDDAESSAYPGADETCDSVDEDCDGDAHSGLRAAIRAVLNSTTWQRRSVHFLRNVLSRVPRKAQDPVSATVRNIFRQPTIDDACIALGRAVELQEPKWPEAAGLLQDAEDDVLAYMQFPDAHWRQIKSTNPLERLNREIRRRTNVVGIFPNDASILRLVTMLLVEQNDEWAVGRRYFSLESMACVTGARSVPPRAMAVG